MANKIANKIIFDFNTIIEQFKDNKEILYGYVNNIDETTSSYITSHIDIMIMELKKKTKDNIADLEDNMKKKIKGIKDDMKALK